MAAPANLALEELQQLYSSTDASAPFTPALIDNIIASAERGILHAPLEDHPAVYSVTQGWSGARVVNQAEADADVAGFSRASRRLHSNSWQALNYVDAHNWASLPRRLRRQRVEYAQLNAELAATAHRLRLASGQPLIELPGQLGVPEHTLKITPLNFNVDATNPMATSFVAGGCRVDIEFTTPAPQSSLARIPTDPELRGDIPASEFLDEHTLNSAVQYARVTDELVVFVQVGAESELIRVLPKFYLHVDEPAPLPELTAARPPLCVPGVTFTATRGDNHYYWAVLQGRRVGIFYATVTEMGSVLPAGKSFAKASLTIEEATEFFKTALRSGYPLTEIGQARRLVDEVATALNESSDPAAQPFIEALAQAGAAA